MGGLVFMGHPLLRPLPGIQGDGRTQLWPGSWLVQPLAPVPRPPAASDCPLSLLSLWC